MDYATYSPLATTHLFKATPTLEQIANHLSLGTIKIRFYQLSTKQVVDEVLITEPFMLRGYVWTGTYLKNGKMKFVENRELSKILFKHVLGTDSIDLVTHFRHVSEGEKFNKYVATVCKKNDCLDEAKHYKIDLKAWNVLNSLFGQFNGLEDELEKKDLWKVIRSKNAGYLNRMPYGIGSQNKVTFYRGGWAERYRFRTGKESNLGKYAFDYLLFMYRNKYRAQDKPASFAATLSGDDLSKVLMMHATSGNIPLCDPEYAGLGERENQMCANRFLSKVNNDWGYIVALCDRQRATPEIVRQLYLFNEHIPGNFFPAFFSDSAHFMSEAPHHLRDTAFLHSVKPYYENDKELATSLLRFANTTDDDEFSEFSLARLASANIYQNLSDDLKVDTDLIRRVGAGAIRYLPTKYLKDRDFLLEVLKLWPKSYTPDLKAILKYAHVSLVRNPSFLKQCFMNKIEGLGVDFYVNEKDEKRLTLDFIGEIRLQMDVDDAFDDDILRINLSILDKVVERRSLRDRLEANLHLKIETSTQRKTKI